MGWTFPKRKDCRNHQPLYHIRPHFNPWLPLHEITLEFTIIHSDLIKNSTRSAHNRFVCNSHAHKKHGPTQITAASDTFNNSLHTPPNIVKVRRSYRMDHTVPLRAKATQHCSIYYATFSAIRSRECRDDGILVNISAFPDDDKHPGWHMYLLYSFNEKPLSGWRKYEYTASPQMLAHQLCGTGGRVRSGLCIHRWSVSWG